MSGEAAVAPPPDVVRVRPMVLGMAAGELAGSLGPCDEGDEHRRCGEASGPPDVEGFAVVVGDDPLRGWPAP